MQFRNVHTRTEIALTIKPLGFYYNTTRVWKFNRGMYYANQHLKQINVEINQRHICIKTGVISSEKMWVTESVI
jgi:hypothetical protein